MPRELPIHCVHSSNAGAGTLAKLRRAGFSPRRAKAVGAQAGAEVRTRLISVHNAKALDLFSSPQDPFLLSDAMAWGGPSRFRPDYSVEERTALTAGVLLDYEPDFFRIDPTARGAYAQDFDQRFVDALASDIVEVGRKRGVDLTRHSPGMSVLHGSQSETASLKNGAVVVDPKELALFSSVASCGHNWDRSHAWVRIQQIFQLADPETAKFSSDLPVPGERGWESAWFVAAHELIHSHGQHGSLGELPMARRRWGTEMSADRGAFELAMHRGLRPASIANIRIYEMASNAIAYARKVHDRGAQVDSMDAFHRAFDQYKMMCALTNRWRLNPTPGSPTITDEMWEDFNRLPSPEQLLELMDDYLGGLPAVLRSETSELLARSHELVLAPADESSAFRGGPDLVLTSDEVGNTMSATLNLKLSQEGLPSLSFGPLECAEYKPVTPEEAAILLPAVAGFRSVAGDGTILPPEVAAYYLGQPLEDDTLRGVERAAAIGLVMTGRDHRISDLGQARRVARSVREGSEAPHRKGLARSIRAAIDEAEVANVDTDGFREAQTLSRTVSDLAERNYGLLQAIAARVS